MKTRSARTSFQSKIAATFDDPATIESSLGEVLIPEAISKWLGRLRLLKGVPFNYLVPDEQMLPPESIRFFYLDMNWVDALIDGAFSIGRNLTKTEKTHTLNLDTAVKPAMQQHAREGALSIRAEALGMPPPVLSLQVVSGFLLRSTVVNAYKGIGANVYPQSGSPMLDILRFEPLGPNSDTLLCLVDGDAYKVDIHEAPEHLHYGIDKYEYDASAKKITATKMIHTFTKEGSEVKLTGKVLPLDHLSEAFRPNSPRVLKMTTLANQIGDLNKPYVIGSAEMGFEMTQGVGMVSFKKEVS